jgi:hypothetical protein
VHQRNLSKDITSNDPFEVLLLVNDQSLASYSQSKSTQNSIVAIRHSTENKKLIFTIAICVGKQFPARFLVCLTVNEWHQYVMFQGQT